MDDLKPSELEDVKFTFGIYADPDGLLDGMKLSKVINCLNFNPSLARLEKFGIPKKEGEKKYKFDEILLIYNELKKEKDDQGCYEDFIECLKLYDKNENGRLLVGELSHTLQNLGEKLSDVQVEEVFEECLGEANDNGEVEYIPFLKRLCGLAPPLKPASSAKK